MIRLDAQYATPPTGARMGHHGRREAFCSHQNRTERRTDPVHPKSARVTRLRLGRNDRLGRLLGLRRFWRGAARVTDMSLITYRKTQTYKYRLEAAYSYATGIRVACRGAGGFIVLSSVGILDFNVGYRWDGPSGPTLDTSNFMRGALVHDALYQFMREGDLPMSYRKQADQILRRICLEDGMSRIRAAYVYYALRMGGASHAKPRPAFPTVTAP